MSGEKRLDYLDYIIEYRNTKKIELIDKAEEWLIDRINQCNIKIDDINQRMAVILKNTQDELDDDLIDEGGHLIKEIKWVEFYSNALERIRKKYRT